jgi:ABC-type amino acid transport substrate-binding protein
MSRRVIRTALAGLGAVALLLVGALPAFAQSTLEKIGRSGTFVVGTRTGSPPFGFIDRNQNWGGFGVDLARLVHAAVEKRLGKSIKFELKETTPATRIPLITSGQVDLIAETMTITRSRMEQVDFGPVYFVTGAQFLVKKGSPIKDVKSAAGKRVAVQQGSTNERILREQHPNVQLVVFPDQPAAFAALVQGRVDAYVNDGVQLAGLKAKAPTPGDWVIVGEPISYEPYGLAMRENDSDFRDLVAFTLMEAVESGTYRTLYEKWMGEKGDVPYPLTPGAESFLRMQVMPK